MGNVGEAGFIRPPLETGKLNYGILSDGSSLPGSQWWVPNLSLFRRNNRWVGEGRGVGSISFDAEMNSISSARAPWLDSKVTMSGSVVNVYGALSS